MNWYRITKRAEWKNLADVRHDFSHADFKGNHYRLIARINYRTRRVFILHILTHEKYAKGAWKA